MWELVLTEFDGRDPSKVDRYLNEGFEPFAITADAGIWNIWLRKEVDEIHKQQSKPDEGKGRRAPSKPKTKESS